MRKPRTRPVPGFLRFPKPLTKDEAEAIREKWLADRRADRFRVTLLP